MASTADLYDIAAEVGRIIRLAGQNFALPVFNGLVDAGTVEKSADDASQGASPVTVADIGVQILVARELARIAPGTTLFGEEFVPEFAPGDRETANAFRLDIPLSPGREDAQAFMRLVRDIIATGKALPKVAIDAYCPLRGRSWLIDPIDGTAYFAVGEPKFAIQLACVENGRVVAGWLYRPVQDQMFRRIGEGPAQLVTFGAEGAETVERLAANNLRQLAEMQALYPHAGRSMIRPQTAMTVVYPHAHLQNPHDDITGPLFLRNGQRIPHEELVARTGGAFAAVHKTDSYSHSVCELLLGHVHAVSTPGNQPWDHFGMAHIARGAGYRVAFIDGQAYLGLSGEIPFTVNAEGQLIVRRSGGMLYAAPAMWDEVNQRLHLAHHPLGEDVTEPGRRMPVLRV